MKTALDDRSPDVGCPTALDGETLAGYMGGRLGEPEAEAFEEHFFSCEECWHLVQTASDVQSALGSEPRLVPAVEPRRARWRILAPAAALAAAVVGVALFGVRSSDPRSPQGEVFRGVERTMSLEATIEGGMLTARWAPIPGAVGYELRAFDGSGRLLIAADADSEGITVDLAAAVAGGVGSVAEVDVAALGDLGQPLVRSDRVTLTP